jgi:hypothetical protein
VERKLLGRRKGILKSSRDIMVLLEDSQCGKNQFGNEPGWK